MFALIVLKTSIGQAVFERPRRQDHATCWASPASASAFVFGPLGDQPVWGRRHDERARARTARSTRVIFAFQVLPTIIFIAALFAILYYFGVMQVVVRLFAVVMNRVMGASGAESLNVAASIFMGQTEAPLTIRPVPARR